MTSDTYSIRRGILAAGVLLSASLGGLASAASDVAAQEALGSSPVSLVVGYAPGGSTDLMARIIAEPLAEQLGRSVIVENRPGGGTVVGTLSVVNAPADGHRLLYGTNATVLNAVLNDFDQYHPLEDLKPVGVVATQSLGLVVHPSLGVETVEGLIEYARENPGEINFASSGNASLQHIAGEMLARTADIDIVHIPYTGAGPALTDLVAGRAQLMITSLLGVQDYLESGDLILIGTTGAERSPSTPDVPTVAEAGYPDYNAISFQAVFAPAGTPDSIVSQLNDGLTAIASDDLVRRINDRGLQLEVTSPEEMADFLAAQAKSYRQIIEEVGIVVE